MKDLIPFTKMHGIGNDFVVINGFEHDIENPAGLAQIACDRHFGIGGDGLCLVLPSKVADIKMRIFNSDGSEAEMCGNGIRGVAVFARDNGLVKKDAITVEIKAGVKKIVLNDAEVTVDMGEPIIGESMRVCGHDGLCVSMGNPHFVIVKKNIKELSLEKVGPDIENSPEFFPNKTNVEFVRIDDKKNIEMRVWERGAGPTLACGTGACASVVACHAQKLTDREVVVSLPGGHLRIDWRKADNHVYMTGPAATVFTGVYNYPRSSQG